MSLTHAESDRIRVKRERLANGRHPQNVDEVRSFLGLSTYYRRFIANFAAVAKPLVRLMEKDVKFEWSSDCERAFIDLKQRLSTAPILAYPNFNEPFILETDASRFAIGAVSVTTRCRQYGTSGLLLFAYSFEA